MSEPRWLDSEAAARYLCIRHDAFLRRVASGIIPPGKSGLGERTQRWWSADLDAVVRGGPDRDSTNTSQMAQAYVEKLEASKGRLGSSKSNKPD
ncbi:MAG TPA: hypothetical protein VHA37_07775 [Candidatus Saccharimonadales bacterium]|nr:hypothetical protein [Candidatus Saccharimonadales bacterium]